MAKRKVLPKGTWPNNKKKYPKFSSKFYKPNKKK